MTGLLVLILLAAAPSEELQILQATLDAHFSDAGGHGRPLIDQEALLCLTTRFTPGRPLEDAGPEVRAAEAQLAEANREALDLEPLAAPRGVLEVELDRCASWMDAFPKRTGIVELSRPGIAGDTAVVRLVARERERTSGYVYVLETRGGDRWTVASSTARIE